MTRWAKKHPTLVVVAVGVGAAGMMIAPAGALGAPFFRPAPLPPAPLPVLDLPALAGTGAWLGLKPEPPWQTLARRIAAVGDLSLAQVAPLAHLIWDEAKQYGRDPYFDASVVLLESNFDPRSTSPAGALGLYQLIPDTAADVSAALHAGQVTADKLYDPAFNVRLGAYYLTLLQKKYGDWSRALTAYNLGEGGLESFMRRHGNAESIYSRRVLELWQELRQAASLHPAGFN